MRLLSIYGVYRVSAGRRAVVDIIYLWLVIGPEKTYGQKLVSYDQRKFTLFIKDKAISKLNEMNEHIL